MTLPHADKPPDVPLPLAVATPLFSVIMPVYNRAPYVREAVESVLAQTFRSWELIIIDDGSTDDSAAIVSGLIRGDPRAALIRQANAGPSAARNAGLARARGPWIAYLDSDDVWTSNTLESYFRYMAGHPPARFLYGASRRLNLDGTISERAVKTRGRTTGTEDLFDHIFLAPSAVCHHRELLGLAGHYDEGLRGLEDYDLFLRMSVHTRFEPLGVVTTLRRRHGGNLSRQTGFSRLREAAILNRFLDEDGPRVTLNPELVRRRMARLYYKAARLYLKRGDFRRACMATRLAHRYRHTLKSVAIGFLALCLYPLSRSPDEPNPQVESRAAKIS
jgi:glycosyltransferase involved in cell wall biosynthesis